MQKRMTKQEGRAFKARWKAVNAAERAELREAPASLRFRQLAALMASVGQLGWTKALAAEEDKVRESWSRLRRIYGD